MAKVSRPDDGCPPGLMPPEGGGGGRLLTEGLDNGASDQYRQLLDALSMTGADITPVKHDGAAEHRQLKGGKKGNDKKGEDDDGGKKGDDDDNVGKKGKGKKSDKEVCVDLDEFPQWREEVGYWIGQYTLLQGDGTVQESESWLYPYGDYTGFITGNIEGGSYRQRNVFLYPPQTEERCQETCFDMMDNDVVGPGECSVNGNSLVFSADQTGCSTDGSISGEFMIGDFTVSTTTDLVGADNALLYQVFVEGALTQSQLTTLHTERNFDGSVKTDRRTRTAQSFGFFGSNEGTSYYREVKAVSKEAFYQVLNDKVTEYNILSDDLCFRDGFTRAPIPGYMPGIEQCVAHLEQSFML